MNIPDTTERMIGALRHDTFMEALKLAFAMRSGEVVETGCYRGGTGDGMSTLVLAFLAHRMSQQMHSFDINGDHIAKARALLHDHRLHAHFHEGDSVTEIPKVLSGRTVGIAYLDSYDYEVENPLPSQEHHAKEAASILPFMAKKSVILVDDCNLEGGGKVKLAEPLILAAGYALKSSAYQKLFVRP